MVKSTMKKLTALVLSSLMMAGVMGTAVVEAHPSNFPGWHHERRDNDGGHSEGEVTTAAIVGAVVGAIIAKNT